MYLRPASLDVTKITVFQYFGAYDMNSLMYQLIIGGENNKYSLKLAQNIIISHIIL